MEVERCRGSPVILGFGKVPFVHIFKIKQNKICAIFGVLLHFRGVEFLRARPPRVLFTSKGMECCIGSNGLCAEEAAGVLQAG